MPYAAGVRRRTDITSDALVRCSASGLQIGILRVREMGQLVESDILVLMSLIFCLVRFPVHWAKQYLSAAWECPDRLTRVKFCARNGARDKAQRFIHQFLQLLIRPPENDAFIIRLVNLPQRFHQKCV